MDTVDIYSGYFSEAAPILELFKEFIRQMHLRTVSLASVDYQSLFIAVSYSRVIITKLCLNDQFIELLHSLTLDHQLNLEFLNVQVTSNFTIMVYINQYIFYHVILLNKLGLNIIFLIILNSVFLELYMRAKHCITDSICAT